LQQQSHFIYPIRCGGQPHSMKRIFMITLFAFIAQTGFSKFIPDSTFTGKKGSFYLLWGYNREVYTKSTIRFQNDGDPTRFDEFGVYDLHCMML
jgi:hypothetical protein